MEILFMMTAIKRAAIFWLDVGAKISAFGTDIAEKSGVEMVELTGSLVLVILF